MLYIASAITPTPIIGSFRVSSLTSPDAISLVVAKPDRVEVWDVDAKGLTWRAELRLWGKIVSIAEAGVESTKPHILVLTGPPNARVYLLTVEGSKLVVASSIPLTPPTPSLREAEFCEKIISQGKIALASVWTGVISCLELDVDKKGRLTLRDNFNINLREHNLLDIAFIPRKCSVAFLWQSSTEALMLDTREVSLAAHSFTDPSIPVNLISPLENDDIPVTDSFDFNSIPYACPAARHLLPISEEHIVVMGDEHSVLYRLLQPTPTSPRVSRGSVSSLSGVTSPRASAVRRSPQHEMLAPGNKRMATTVRRSRQLQPVWRVRQGFGVVLASTTLETHSTGASMLMSDESGALTAIGWEFEGKKVQVTVMDLGTTSPASALVYLDSAHVFVSSVYGDAVLLRLSMTESARSSPKSVRKGKGPARDEDQWVVEIAEGKGSFEVRERWMNLAPLRDFVTVEGDGGSYLVAASGASTSNSLRVIRSGAGLEQVLSVEGLGATGLFRVNEGLLVSSDLTVRLALPDFTVEPLVSLPTIAAGSIGDVAIIVNRNGVTCGGFTWNAEVLAAAVCSSLVLVGQKSSMTILTATEQGISESSTIAIKGEISSVAIAGSASPVVAVATWTGEIFVYMLETRAMPIKEQSHAVSLILRPRDTSVQLLAGLADGSMIVYEFEHLDVVSRKVSSLGTRPLSLYPVSVQYGEDVVIAVGLTERMSLVFETKGRIDFAAVSKKGVTAATQDGDHLVLATSSGITFETVTSLKKLSIQTLDLGERAPVKLVSCGGMLGVGTVIRRMDRETGDVIESSRFDLRDQGLELLVEMPLGPREEITSLSSVGPHVAIGTAVDDRGKLYLVEPREGEIRFKATCDMDGPVHDVKMIHDLLAVAAGSKVSMLRQDLSEVSSFASTFIASSLHIKHNKLIVGDGMRSIFVLDVDASGALFTEQRDLATHRVNAIEGVSDGIVIADGHANLLTMRLDPIETAASFGLHEDVAAFKRGSLVPSATEINPELLFATTEGRLGVIGELSPGAARTLSDLQRNMDKYVQGPGGIQWKSWRGSTAGFIDGDFIQTINLEEESAIQGTNQHERVMKLEGGEVVPADKAEIVGILQAVGGVH